MKSNCEICGSSVIDTLTSMAKYYCCECKEFYPFELKEGQHSVLIKNKVGKGERIASTKKR